MRWRLKGVLGSLIVAVSAVAAAAQTSVLSPSYGHGGATAVKRPSAVTLFAGSEIDRANRYGSIGFKLRPLAGYGNDMFTMQAAIGGGRWMETGPLALNRESDSQKFAAHVLAGVEFSVAGGHLGLFAGPEFFRETATDPRGVTLRRERRFGARVHVDWWSHPTDRTMLSLNAAAGSAKRDLSLRGAFGWRIGGKSSPWGYIGPEAALYASRSDVKARLGAHWSEFGSGVGRFRLSIGVVKESGRKISPYLSTSGYFNF